MKRRSPVGRAALALLLTSAVLVLLPGGVAWGEDPPAPAPAPKKPAPAPKAKPAPKQPAPAPAPAPGASDPAAELAEAPEEAALPPPPMEFNEDGWVRLHGGPTDGQVIFFYRTNFVKPSELAKGLVDLLPIPDMVYKPLVRQNVLLMQGEEDDVSLAVEAAAYLDVASPQVFIEAKVLEITYDSNFEFGLNYLWDRGAGPPTLFQGAAADLSPTSFLQSQVPGGLPFQGTSLLFGFVGEKAREYGLLDAQLQAMQMDGKAEVLSKPSIVCTEGLPAEVMTQEDRQIVQFQNADRNNERYQGSNLRTGVKLTVKAIHVGENFVTLEINPVVNGLQGVGVSGGQTLRPILTTRSAKTTVTMRDGETLIIGGLYTNAKIRSKAKTPLVSDIPILGCLFTRTQEAKAKSELIFMLTPTIIRKSAEFQVFTPPAELERLEESGDECWRPAGPSLTCPDECKPKPAPAPVPAPCTPPRRTSTPYNSTPSSVPRER